MDTTSFQVLGTPKRVVLASVDQNRNNGSPISPMANLKLLTKVATSLDQEKTDSVVVQPYKLKTPVKYQRQLRSLGYICKKFLDIYKLDIPYGDSKQISLGNLTVLLDIEKRRVYDIINIIASLRYASKVCKDKYCWYGNQHLISTLTGLRSLAFTRNYHTLLQKCLMNDLTFDNFDEINQSGANSDQFSENDEGHVFDDNRIGALCQKSMMLFLIAPKGEAINFKIISQIILPRDVQDKTGMRRLYDISNVLESLGLIKRCDSKLMKRPTFVYSGPELPSSNNLDILTGFDGRLTDIEHLSDTSSDGSELKLPAFFDFVDTEIRELEKSMDDQYLEKVQCLAIPAKKQLFRETSIKPSGFIKAPQSSFKFTSNGLVKVIRRDSNQNHIKTMDPQQSLLTSVSDFSQPLCTNLISNLNDSNLNKTVYKLNNISRSFTVYKFSPAQNSIENGGIYKAIKHGNVINLVQLKSSH